ncbi:amidohydrolase [Leptolyngbya sp. Heron Island J]|uniref:M20 family metallopeptidase n=1 Tax=Leptolyngbya sp. Heron Island J TaxID=1385935 RepID=UPI0003B93B9F|nr:M20 family metallopeptidase [Leptolyngbya sp. Heron Island J]ESA34915.1 amidohydrolase [Leptolyngbya sp. Heron Island J]
MHDQIKAITEKITPRLIEIRRHIHAHPELSGQEYQTAAYVAGVMSSYGFHVQEMVGKTGVVANLEGTGEISKILAVRTDMDALPIPEQVDLPFVSKNRGIMHACGHDVHTTVGLGTAMVLAELTEQQRFAGTTRFLFQPAEETVQGAKWMIADDVLADVAAIFGVHVFPSIQAGNVGLRRGALTAAADDLEIVIIGESGHGARPHEAIDAIWVASQVMTTLQQAISRRLNPLHPAVVTIGKISGGKAANVIADRVVMQGTVRSLQPDTYEKLPTWIEEILAGVCAMHGAKYELNYQRRVASVINTDYLVQIVANAAQSTLGESHIEWLPEPSMGSEDFALYTERVPGTMFRLGVGFPDRHNHPLHHPKFEVDENAIATGVLTMATSVYEYWQRRV